MNDSFSTRPRSKHYTSLIIFVATCTLFSAGALFFSLSNFFESKSVVRYVRKFKPGRPLPSSYLVDDWLIGPVLNQYARGTCWLFQITAILEAQYKKQGIELGYINKTEYMKLSEEAIGKFMVEACMKDPTNPNCTASPRLRNTTSSGNADEFLQFYTSFSEFHRSVLPYECCPYQSKPENEMICENYTTCLKSNPLDFTVKRIFLTNNIRDVKQRLIDQAVPQALSLTMPLQRYLFPCSQLTVFNRSICQNKLLRCPHNNSIFCSPNDFKLFKIKDVDFIFHSNGITVPGTGHAMLLVGYNDAFVANRPLNYTERADVKGGFILRNSWGARGHSLEYLLGRMTEDQEASICPNKDNVFRWVTASLECLKANKNVSKCNTNMKLRRGSKIITHSDELKCINDTHCDKTKKYALLGDGALPSIEWSSEGVPLGKVIEWDDSSEPQVKTIETLPIQHLYYAFNLTDSAENRDGVCGFVFLPYEVLEDLMRVNAGTTIRGYWNTQGIQVEWAKGSYAKSGEKGDFSMVSKSMRKTGLIQPSSLMDEDL